MQPIYVEVSDEITTVIERMKEASDLAVALVVPKGAILLQSIVNLKLARKAAADQGKKLTLITTDKIGRNLANQLGIEVFSRLDEKEGPADTQADVDEGSEPHVIAGVKVHRYYEQDDSVNTEENEAPIEPIIPKNIMRETTISEEVVKEDDTPITVREVRAESESIKAKGSSQDSPLEVATLPAALEKESPTMLKEVSEVSSKKTITEEVSPEPTTEPVIETISSKAKGSPKPDTTPKKHRPLFLVAYLIILLLIGASGVAAFYLPKTIVTIVAKADAWQEEVIIKAQPSLPENTTEVLVKSELITAEVSGSVSFKATGTNDVGEKAKGTAQIFNGYSSSSQSLPAGAKLSANGRDFYTQTAVTVPGATVVGGKPVPGSINVEVIADASGPESNMANVTGTVVSPASNLYCQIVSTTNGSTKQVSVLTQTDITTAKAALSKKVQEESKAKLVESLKDREVVSDEATDSFSLDGFAVSVPAGTEAENAQVSGKGVSKRLIVDKKALNTLAQNHLTHKGDSSSHIIIDEVKVAKTEFNLIDQNATIYTTVLGRTSKEVPAERIRSQLVGKKLANGQDMIKSLTSNTTSKVEQSPSWWPLKNFPYSPKYLQVIVKYE